MQLDPYLKPYTLHIHQMDYRSTCEKLLKKIKDNIYMILEKTLKEEFIKHKQ